MCRNVKEKSLIMGSVLLIIFYVDNLDVRELVRIFAFAFENN